MKPAGQTVIEVPFVGNEGWGKTVIRIFGVPIPADNIKVDITTADRKSLRPVAHSIRYEAFK